MCCQNLTPLSVENWLFNTNKVYSFPSLAYQPLAIRNSAIKQKTCPLDLLFSDQWHFFWPMGFRTNNTLFRTNGSLDQWVFGPMGFRTNGPSDQLVCGPMCRRTNGLSDHRDGPYWQDNSGLSSPEYPVKTATNKTAARRNGDNLIGDNSVISATDKVKMAKKQQVKTATMLQEEEGREKKRREKEGRKRITN